MLTSCPGGTDAGAAAAWQAALNQTGPFMPDFSGLEMYDLMSVSALPLLKSVHAHDF